MVSFGIPDDEPPVHYPEERNVVGIVADARIWQPSQPLAQQGDCSPFIGANSQCSPFPSD